MSRRTVYNTFLFGSIGIFFVLGMIIGAVLTVKISETNFFGSEVVTKQSHVQLALVERQITPTAKDFPAQPIKTAADAFFPASPLPEGKPEEVLLFKSGAWMGEAYATFPIEYTEGGITQSTTINMQQKVAVVGHAGNEYQLYFTGALYEDGTYETFYVWVPKSHIIILGKVTSPGVDGRAVVDFRQQVVREVSR